MIKINWNDKADNIAEAKQIAEKKLKELNDKEVTGQISLMGDFRFSAGNNIEIKDFGALFRYGARPVAGVLLHHGLGLQV